MDNVKANKRGRPAIAFRKSLSAKFLAMAAVAALLFSAFVICRSYQRSSAQMDELLTTQTELALHFDIAIRSYVGQTIRPFAAGRVEQGEFIPEVMSSSFIARSIFEDLRNEFPDYVIKFSSDNPRNPQNTATPEEIEMIRYFETHPEANTWSGPVNMDGRQYLAHFYARRMEPSCLQCHGDPADAPDSLIKRYGDTGGFDRKLGSVIALDTVAIPTGAYKAAAMKHTLANSLMLTVGICLFLAAVYWAFHVFVARKLALISNHFRQTTAYAENGLVGPIEYDRDDEIGVVVDSFNALAGRLQKFHESLEQRVDERTTQLSRANENLETQIAERRQAEEQVAKLARFPDENPLPVARIDGDGTVLYSNLAGAALLDLWQCEQGGKLSGNWAEFAASALTTDTRKQIEVECGDKILALTFAPIVEADYINCYGLDITDRRKAEQKITETLNDIRRHNQLMAGREARILELKHTANTLLAELGRESAFRITTDDSNDEPLAVGPCAPGRNRPAALHPNRDGYRRTRNHRTPRRRKTAARNSLHADPLFGPAATPHTAAEFFARNGLDVRLVPTLGWSGIKELMASGKLEVAHMLAPMPLASTLAIDGKQADITLAAVQNINGQALTLAKQYADITDIRDMKGFTFAVPYRFSMHYYLLCYFLAANGLDPLNDVTIKEVTPPRMPYHLKQGWVDGIFAPEPFNQMCVQQETGFIHTLSRDIWNGHPCCCLATVAEFTRKYPNTYNALVESVVEAELALHNADPDRRADIAAEISGARYLNQENVQPVAQALSGHFPDGRDQGCIHSVPDRIDFIPQPWPQHGKWILSQMQRWAHLPGKVDYNQIVESVLDSSVMETAQAIGFEKNARSSVETIKPFNADEPFEYMQNQPFCAYTDQPETLPARSLTDAARERLDRIVSHLSDVAGGRTVEPLTITNSDEIGRLESLLNETMQNLQFTQQTVLEQKDILETRVQLRTDELLQSEKIALSMMEDANFSKQQTEVSKAQVEQINHRLEQSIHRANELATQATGANKAKSEFLANMSHEIRTPLNAIIGFSQVLSEQSMTHEQGEYVGIIRDSGETLLRLISDILDFSKIEAGRLDTERISFSLQRLLDTLESLMSPKAARKKLDFEIVTCNDLPAYIVTDPARLRQCLINLIDNAVKFTETGHVYVNTSIEIVEAVPFIRFDIEDTGIGIPPDRQKAIFEAFTQADGSTTRKFGGTGLGLTITRKLAALLGGSLSLSSEPDRGTVFSLTIPAGLDIRKQPQLVDVEDTDHTTQDQTLPQLSGRVLVAEDTLTNQMLIRLLLEKTGLEVEIVDGR